LKTVLLVGALLPRTPASSASSVSYGSITSFWLCADDFRCAPTSGLTKPAKPPLMAGRKQEVRQVQD